jgi:chromosome partitioning protein
MMKCLAIINQKGGVGKSTTAAAIGEALQLMKHKVLYIDLDPQGNLSYVMSAEPERTAYDIMMKAPNTARAITETAQGDIIGSSPKLAGADGFIAGIDKEYRLRSAIDQIKDRYNFIIIDTPPALGILTVNALAAADTFIVPAQADVFSLQGISQLVDVAETVKEFANPELAFDGILLTRHNSRTIISRSLSETLSEAATAWHTRLYKTTIRECIAIREAQISKKGLFAYAPKSNAAADYMALTKEILKGASK